MDSGCIGVTEQALLLGRAHPLVAIVTTPAGPFQTGPPPAAMILLNSGLVHRVGPGRLYVKIARRMAASGFVAVRFDHSGIGDSSVRRDTQPFQQSYVQETRELMDVLGEQRGIEHFVLAGICSGADTAFRMACSDSRVLAAVMINATGYANSVEWGSYVVNRKWAKQYWKESLFRLDSWRRALTGRIQYRRLFTVLLKHLVLSRSKEVGSVVKRVSADLRGLIAQKKQLLVINSEWDLARDCLEVILNGELAALRASGTLRLEIIPRTDHIFTLLSSQQRVIDIIENWSRTALDVETRQRRLPRVDSRIECPTQWTENSQAHRGP